MRPVTQFVTVAALTILIPAALPSHAHAAPAGSQPPASTSTEDVYYDFEVYVAFEVTTYYVKYETKNGVAGHFGFNTLSQAEVFVDMLWNLGQVKSVEIITSVGPGPWQFVTIYDKRGDAEQMADAIEDLGFYAKVERVFAMQFPSRTQP